MSKRVIIILILMFMFLIMGFIFCSSIPKNKIVRTSYIKIPTVEKIHTSTMRVISNTNTVKVKTLLIIKRFDIVLLECSRGYIFNFECEIERNSSWIPVDGNYTFILSLYNRYGLFAVYKFVIRADLIKIKNKTDFVLSKPQFLYLSGIKKIRVELQPIIWKEQRNGSSIYKKQGQII